MPRPRTAPVLAGTLLLLTLPAVPLSAAAAAVPTELAVTPSAPGAGPSAVIVRWADSADLPAQAAARAAVGARLRERLPLDRTEVLEVPVGSSADALVAALLADTRVRYAEPDAVVRPSTADPGYGLQWGLENSGQLVNDRPGTPDVDIDEGRATAQVAEAGGGDVLVAVTDSGVDVRHPDLAGAVWTNPDEVGGNGVDDDRNGYVDDVNGWDFTTDEPGVYDDPLQDEHGTHVAGTIGAVRDNRQGVAGVSSRVRLMPLKFIGPDGGATSDAIRAIVYARDEGARVINASWGGPEESQALRDAIAGSGAVFVAAAGNEGKNNDVAPDFPASYRLDNVLSVAAVGNQGELAGFSNRGPTSVDLGAPGVDVLSTVPGGGYAYLNGTSMAAPHVSGAAALVLSVRPDLEPAQVVSLLLDTVAPLPSLTLSTRTGGLVNAGDAVAAARGGTQPGPAVDAPTEPNGDPDTGSAAPPEACPDGIPSAGFSDVVGNVHQRAIDCGVWYGVLRGTSATTYTPEPALQRGQVASQLAAILDRAGRLPASAPDAFLDDDTSVHQLNINKLVALGILTGRGPGRFEPTGPVSRGQIATALVKTRELLDGRPLPARPTTFADILTSVHRENIEKATAAGLVRGTSSVTYEPDRGTRRDQAASVVVNLLAGAVTAGQVPEKRST